MLNDISFSVSGGEILGIAGISGCGSGSCWRASPGFIRCPRAAAFCITPKTQETPQSLWVSAPCKSEKLGVALSFVPEDRLGMGLVGAWTLPTTCCCAAIARGRLGFATGRNPGSWPKRSSGSWTSSRLAFPPPLADCRRQRPEGAGGQGNLPGAEGADDGIRRAGLDINTSYTIYGLLNEQKEKRCRRHLCGRRLGRSAGAVRPNPGPLRRQGQRHRRRRTATKEEIGLMMTQSVRGETA